MVTEVKKSLMHNQKIVSTGIQSYKAELKHTVVPAWVWCYYQQLKMNHEAFPKGSYLTKLTIRYGELVGGRNVLTDPTHADIQGQGK